MRMRRRIGLLWFSLGMAVACTGVDFGDDAGIYALDGECDDPRFEGEGLGLSLESHRGHDASDCRALFRAGRVRAPDSTVPRGDDEALADPEAYGPATYGRAASESAPSGQATRSSFRDDPLGGIWQLCQRLFQSRQAAQAETELALSRRQLRAFEELAHRADTLQHEYQECRSEYGMLGGQRILP